MPRVSSGSGAYELHAAVPLAAPNDGHVAGDHGGNRSHKIPRVSLSTASYCPPAAALLVPQTIAALCIPMFTDTNTIILYLL